MAGVTDRQIEDLARGIGINNKLDSLGSNLGFKSKEKMVFKANNYSGANVTFEGTIQMLREYCKKIPMEEQRPLLKQALQDAGFVRLSEIHLGGSKRPSASSIDQDAEFQPKKLPGGKEKGKNKKRKKKKRHPISTMHKEGDLPPSQFKELSIKKANPEPGHLNPDENYVMWESKRKGQMFIMCNHKFPKKTHNLPKNKVDARNVENLFNQLGYSVKTHYNLQGEDLCARLEEFIQFENTEECPQSAIIYLTSHGGDGVIIGSDYSYVPIAAIKKMFSATKCPKLIGKPKIIIIDACWGAEITRPVDAKGVRETEKYIPDNADIFVIHATAQGKIALSEAPGGCKSLGGSFFTDQMCEEFYKSSHEDDLDTLLHKVTGRIKSHRSLVNDGKGGKWTMQSPTVIKQGVDKKLYFCPGYVQNE